MDRGLSAFLCLYSSNLEKKRWLKSIVGDDLSVKIVTGFARDGDDESGQF